MTMRYFLSYLWILLTAASVCHAQSVNKAYKVLDSQENGGGSCEEYFHLIYLFEELTKQPDSSGLIVVYAGDKNERFGNIAAYVRGAREFISEYNAAYYEKSPKQISVVVAEGGSFSNEDFWVVPRGADIPDVRPATRNWDELTGRYRFGSTCLHCEPSYPHLTNFQANYEDYASVLKQYPNLRGLVTVSARWKAKQVSEELTTKRKLPRKRYRIRVSKNLSDDFFIIPDKPTTTSID